MHTDLTEDQIRCLRCAAGMMIPASAAFGVPGADEDRIFADIVGSLGRDAPQVKQALLRLDAAAGGSFADADLGRREQAAGVLRADGGAPLLALSRVVAQAYYRDDRVMQSLGMEVRPPFPKGYTVEQGDWSLLETVRARPAFYRLAP